MCSVIRKARLSKGYSQHYLSVQLEVSPKTYQRMEKNETKISIEKLAAIAEILETNFEELAVKTITKEVVKTKFNVNAGLTDNRNGAKPENKPCCDIVKHLKAEVIFLRNLIKKKFEME